MSESALTFEELQIHLAVQLGVAYYGAAGDEVAQPPTDTPTLQQLKDYINGGIRMFLADAPLEGWEFQQPVASITLWSTATSTADGVPVTTTITVDDEIFTDEMVGHNIIFSATSNSYKIVSVTSSTIAIVDSDASGEADEDTVTVTADGNYTLPSTFQGEYLGDITFTGGTQEGGIEWIGEGRIRELRENTDSQTGTPYLAAIRKLSESTATRRWEMMVYPIPDSDFTVHFPYELYFTALTNDADYHPAGANYDEVVLAACEAYAELKGEDAMAGRMQYYQQKALPAAHRRNLRSKPKRLGSLKKSTRVDEDWRYSIRRPDVTIEGA